jgi:hypothetical protein
METGMRKCIWFAATGGLLLAIGMAWAQNPAVPQRKPTPVFESASPSLPTTGFCWVRMLRAMPSTIPFMANNPSGSVAGGSVATVSWNIAQGRRGQTWTLTAGTGSPSFQGCTSVPASAVSVKCTSASVDGGGQASAGCNLSSFTTLPNTLPGLPVARGTTGDASSHNYTVVLGYELADSWRYIPKTCPLTVTYSVNADD